MNKDKEGLIGGILIIGLRNKIEVKETQKVCKTGENIKSYFVVLWHKKRWLRNIQGDPSLQEKSLAGGINKYIFRLFYQ